MYFGDAAGNIESAFKSQPDVIILGGVSGVAVDGKSLFHDMTAEKLKAYVHNGGGLVYVDGAIPAKAIPNGKKDDKGQGAVRPGRLVREGADRRSGGGEPDVPGRRHSLRRLAGFLI